MSLSEPSLVQSPVLEQPFSSNSLYGSSNNDHLFHQMITANRSLPLNPLWRPNLRPFIGKYHIFQDIVIQSHLSNDK